MKGELQAVKPLQGVGSGSNLWRVKYSTVFSSSSSERGAYTIREDGIVGHVATIGDSIGDVADAIRETLSCQQSLGDLEEAVWLGRLI